MKLSMNTDFTKLPRTERVAEDGDSSLPAPFGIAVLAHDERHLRRRVITLQNGDKILVDLAEPVMLAGGDRLVLDDGRHIEVIAAEEDVYEVRAHDAVHLAELCWHIGNRHLAAQIEAERIVILRDHVIKAMLEGLGATVAEVSAPFEPVRGAYAGHGGHDHDDHVHHEHDHAHHEHDHHEHGGRDAFGRLPGDPHYGHNHA